MLIVICSLYQKPSEHGDFYVFQITETKVRALFDTHGTITNCSLKFNSEGGFRRFAFIGFAEDEQAAKAIDTLNNTFVDTSRIQVKASDHVKVHSHTLLQIIYVYYERMLLPSICDRLVTD